MTLDLNNDKTFAAVRLLLAWFALAQPLPNTADAAHRVVKSSGTNWGKDERVLMDAFWLALPGNTAAPTVQSFANEVQPAPNGLCVPLQMFFVGGFSLTPPPLTDAQMQMVGTLKPAYQACVGISPLPLQIIPRKSFASSETLPGDKTTTAPAKTSSVWPWLLGGAAVAGVVAVVFGGKKKRR